METVEPGSRLPLVETVTHRDTPINMHRLNPSYPLNPPGSVDREKKQPSPCYRARLNRRHNLGCLTRPASGSNFRRRILDRCPVHAATTHRLNEPLAVKGRAWDGRWVLFVLFVVTAGALWSAMVLRLVSLAYEGLLTLMQSQLTK